MESLSSIRTKKVLTGRKIKEAFKGKTQAEALAIVKKYNTNQAKKLMFNLGHAHENLKSSKLVLTTLVKEHVI